MGSPLNVEGAPAALSFPGITGSHFSAGSVWTSSPLSVAVTSTTPWVLCIGSTSTSAVVPLLDWSEDGTTWTPFSVESAATVSRPPGTSVAATLYVRMRLAWEDAPPGQRSATLTISAVAQP